MLWQAFSTINKFATQKACAVGFSANILEKTGNRKFNPKQTRAVVWSNVFINI